MSSSDWRKEGAEGGFPHSYLSSPGLFFVSPFGCSASFVEVSRSDSDCSCLPSDFLKHPGGEANTT